MNKDVKKHMKYLIPLIVLFFSSQLFGCNKTESFKEFLKLYRVDRDFQIDHVAEPFEFVVAKGEYDGKSWDETSLLTLKEIKNKNIGLYAQPKIIEDQGYVEIIEKEDGGVYSVTVGPPNSSSVVIFYFKMNNGCWNAFKFRDIWSIHAS